MPLLQAMSERANAMLTREAIRNLSPGDVAGDTLVEVLQNLGIVTTGAEAAYLDAWPPTLREVLRAVLVRAVADEQPLAIAWAPAYDYQITIWEAADTDVSPGGLTVLLQSRYPGHAPIQSV